jgi:hypothetical protein
MTNRRDFIALLGGATLIRPTAGNPVAADR